MSRRRGPSLVKVRALVEKSSYAALQRILETPEVGADGKKEGIRVVDKAEVQNLMITVQVRMENGVPVIRVADLDVVDPDELITVLRTIRKATNKAQILLDHSDDVPHGTVVMIQDAAKDAEIDRIHFLVPKQ